MDDSDRHYNRTDCNKHSDGNSNLTNNNEPDDNDHVYCDGSHAAYSSAYSWFPVGIDPGGARAGSAGRASDLPKSSGKKGRLSIELPHFVTRDRKSYS